MKSLINRMFCSLVISTQLFAVSAQAQIVISPGGLNMGGGGLDGGNFSEQFNFNPSFRFGMVDPGINFGQAQLSMNLLSLMSGGQINLPIDPAPVVFGADGEKKDGEDRKDEEEKKASDSLVTKMDNYGYAFSDGQPVPPAPGRSFDSFVYDDGRGVVVGSGVWTDRFSENGNLVANMSSGQFYPAGTLRNNDVGNVNIGTPSGGFENPGSNFHVPQMPNLSGIANNGLSPTTPSLKIPENIAINGLCTGFASNLSSTIGTVGEVFSAADLASRAGFGDPEAQAELKIKAQKALETTERILNATSILAGPTIFDPSSRYDEQSAKQIEAWNKLSEFTKAFIKKQWENFESKSQEEQTELIGKATGWVMGEILTGAFVMKAAETMAAAVKTAETVGESAKTLGRAGEELRDASRATEPMFGKSKVGPEYNHYLEKGPVPEKAASNFYSKTYTSIRPTEGEVFYRWGDANGSYWSRTPPTSQMQAMSDSAILPDWNDFSKVTEVRVPKGADWEFFEGNAGSQSGNFSHKAPPQGSSSESMLKRQSHPDTGRASGYFSGGGNQVYIKKNFLDEQKFIDSVKTYTIDEWKRLHSI